MQSNEYKRKAVHALFGMSAYASTVVLGVHATIVLVLLFSFFAISTIHVKRTGMKIFDMLFSLERDGVAHGKGAITLLLGILAALSFAKTMGPTIVLVLAISDAVATIAGKTGKTMLPWNMKKSIRGFGAFFLTALPLCVLTIDPAQGVVLAMLLTIAESLPRMDDNLAIPIAGIAFSFL